MARGKLRGLTTLWKAQTVRGAAALLLASFPAVCGAEPAFAKPRSLFASVKDTIQSAGQATPTPAWVEFCERQPRECAVDRTESATIALDQQTWGMISHVNEQVNGAILPVTDQDYWGVADRWDYPDDGLGDCEDIQLLKRKLLVEAGLPRRALLMTVVIDEQGAGHAVLMVRTDHGDFILDNKRNAVLPWQETGYRYVKREGGDGKEWVWLEDRTAPVVTANK